MFARAWPIALAVFSDVVYQIGSKSTPPNVNVFASLTLTYLIGAAVSLFAFYISSGGGNVLAEMRNANWSALLLGLAGNGMQALLGYGVSEVAWATGCIAPLASSAEKTDLR